MSLSASSSESSSTNDKMKFDIFLSICQTEVDGLLPDEKTMFKNFFDQVVLADDLGFETAWIAEAHLSCQVQKENPGAVIPHFKGEIGLNTDVLQIAHKVFAKTKNINVGSAIRNILCNGGPMAHAEAVKTFLSLNELDNTNNRKLELGFASGRFPFSNTPYGIYPKNEIEKAAWPALKGKVFLEATEIFLKFLKGDVFSSADVQTKTLSREDFRSDADWQNVVEAYKSVYGKEPSEVIEFDPIWKFDKVGVIPFEAPLENLNLTIGSHDPKAQIFANQFLPTGVFNLSITPGKTIEETHQRMSEHYQGTWDRSKMPRTVLVFVNNESGLTDAEKTEKAKQSANKAIGNYWKAIEGTLNEDRVQNASENALLGNPQEVIAQIKERFHPQDRLMLWFDFNNHNNDEVKQNMKWFMEDVAPHV